MHDMFDSFTEYIHTLKKLILKFQNTRIVIFNFPGNFIL